MTKASKFVRRASGALALSVLLVCALSHVCSGYSVLTHEQFVDLLWDEQIKPLLLQKYPGTSAEDLRVAHGYAYGGCLIQDMGYYPFGNRFFSDLVHYVRSGDFVAACFRKRPMSTSTRSRWGRCRTTPLTSQAIPS